MLVEQAGHSIEYTCERVMATVHVLRKGSVEPSVVFPLFWPTASCLRVAGPVLRRFRLLLRVEHEGWAVVELDLLMDRREACRAIDVPIDTSQVDRVTPRCTRREVCSPLRTRRVLECRPALIITAQIRPKRIRLAEQVLEERTVSRVATGVVGVVGPRTWCIRRQRRRVIEETDSPTLARIAAVLLLLLLLLRRRLVSVGVIVVVRSVSTRGPPVALSAHSLLQQ